MLTGHSSNEPGSPGFVKHSFALALQARVSVGPEICVDKVESLNSAVAGYKEDYQRTKKVACSCKASQRWKRMAPFGMPLSPRRARSMQDTCL